VTERDKKMVKLLSILGPVFLLTIGYGYSQIRKTRARQAERRQEAQAQQQTQAASQQAQSFTMQPAADRGARAQSSPPPGVTPADQPAPVPPAALAGLQVCANVRAQDGRMDLPWGRDPFVPPDTEGPRIAAPDDLESPRDAEAVTVEVRISDESAGNSGVRGAVLSYGEGEPFDAAFALGTRPASENGDGVWRFRIPTPNEQPYGCYVVATDGGRLASRSRSKVFRVTPPAQEKLQTQVGGADVMLTLRGISCSDGCGVALINDDVLMEGEDIQGYEVLAITETGVVLRRGDREVLLQLKE